jgi:hypothetical protein
LGGDRLVLVVVRVMGPDPYESLSPLFGRVANGLDRHDGGDGHHACQVPHNSVSGVCHRGGLDLKVLDEALIG